MAEPPPARPPPSAERLLGWFLGSGDKGRAILGDLHEDFLVVVREEGEAAGHRWYWREALALCLRRTPRPWDGAFASGRSHDARGDGMMMMMGLVRDLRLAARAQRRRLGATVMVVAALGVGIGSSTAVFSALRTVLMPHYPFDEPERLVFVNERVDGELGRMTVPAIQTLRADVRSMTGIAAYRPANLNLTGLEIPQRLNGLYVTADFFDLLGIQPVRGAGFDSSDEVEGSQKRVVLGHGLWTRIGGGSSEILGSVLTLDGAPYVVAGVLSEDFWFPDLPDVLLPVGSDEAFTHPSDTRRVYRAIGRLAEGFTGVAARDDLQRVVGETSGSGAPELAVTRLQNEVMGNSGRVLGILQAAAGLLLILGLANATGIILARSVDRRGEVLVRLALGAGRTRLSREAMAEGLLLGAAGGTAGLGIASALLEVLPKTTTVALAGPGALGVDGGTLAFCVVASLTTGALVSVLPALLVARAAGRASLGERRWATGSPIDRRVQHALLVGQVALSTALAVGAGSVTRSLLEVMAHDPGFRSDGVLTMRLSLSGDRYTDSEAIASFFHRLTDRVRSLTAVEDAGVTLALPFSGTNISMPMQFSADAEPPVTVEANFRTVAGDYFRTLEIPLVEGRHAFSGPSATAAREAMVSEAVARRLGRSPLGLTLRLTPDAEEGFEVVGVVGDVRHFELTRPPEPEVYLGYEAYPMTWGYLAARTEADPLGLVPAIQRTVADLDATQPVYSIYSLEERLIGSVGRERLVVVLLVLFAGSAVLIMGAGLYGVASAHVARLTRELGVRSALGANSWSLMNRTLRGVGAAVGVGVTLGLLGTGATMGLVEAWVYEAPRPEPMSLVLAAGAILVTALVASCGPARRATRVDPVRALTAE